MQNIKSLVTKLITEKGRQKEFEALSILDSNAQELLNRIKALEARNMKYFCTVQASATQNIPILIGLTVSFDITVYPQFGNMHTNTPATNQDVYIRRNGVYHLAAGVMIEGGAGTFKEARINVVRNGLPITAVFTRLPNVAINLAWALSRSVYLYIGDIVQLYVAHDAGAGLDLIADTTLGTPFLSVSERMEDLDPSEYGLLNPEENTRG